MIYLVISWATDEILSKHKTLASAKRHARGKGHTGEVYGSRFLPIAFVSDGTKVNELFACIYNPHFATQISATVGNLINAQPSNGV